MSKKLTFFTVLAINFERKGIHGCGLNLLESRHFEHEFEHKFRIFFDTNQESYSCLNMADLAT